MVGRREGIKEGERWEGRGGGGKSKRKRGIKREGKEGRLEKRGGRGRGRGKEEK